MAFNNTFDRLRRFGTGEITVIGVVDQDDNTNQALGPGNEHRFDFFADDHLTGTLMLRAELVSDTFTLLSQGTTRLLGNAANPWNQTFTNAVRAGTGTALTLERQDGTAWATLDSGTGQTIISINTVLLNNIEWRYGNGSDFRALWSTAQAADAMVYATGVGTAAQSGNIIFTTIANQASDHGLAARAQPNLFIFSQTASPALQYANIYHDTANAHFDSGAGGIRLDPANNIVEIRRDTAAVNTELRINNGSATGLSSMSFFESIGERARLEYDNTADTLTLNTLLAADVLLQRNSVTLISLLLGQVLVSDDLRVSDSIGVGTAPIGTIGRVDLADRIFTANGTAGIPAHSFTADTNTGMYRVGSDQLGFAAGAVNILTLDGGTPNSAAATITQPVVTSGTPLGALVVIGAANVSLPASAEALGINLNLSATMRFATGALTTQRAMLLQAPTYAFVAASVITTAATLSITGAPQEGAFATITNPAALLVESGSVGFFSATPTFGGGVGVLFLGNAGTVPTTNPTGGAIQYSESDDVKIRLASGDIIVIAEAP